MATVTSNQVRLLKTKFLQILGAEKSSFTIFGGGIGEVELKVAEGILEQFAFSFIKKAQDNIDKAGATYLGNMSSDLAFTIEKKEDSYLITVGYPPNSEASKYYDYNNKGVDGIENKIGSPYSFKTKYPSKKMAVSILQWVRKNNNAARFDTQKKGLSALQKKRFRLRDAVSKSNDFKALAYAMATSIKKKGIKPTHFFDDAITETFGNNFRQILAEALAADISIQIRSTNGN